MPSTKTYELSGSVALKIGSNAITLDSGDLKSSPLVYRMPDDEEVSTELKDILDFFNNTLGGAISIPADIMAKIESTLSIQNGYISSAGDVSLNTKMAFKGGKGFEIFSGLSVESLSLHFKCIPASAVVSITPATAKPGDKVKIGGTGLAGIQSVKIGDKTILKTDLTNATDNNFLTVTVPAGTKAGKTAITIKGASGEVFASDETKLPFEVTA